MGAGRPCRQVRLTLFGSVVVLIAFRFEPHAAARCAMYMGARMVF